MMSQTPELKFVRCFGILIILIVILGHAVAMFKLSLFLFSTEIRFSHGSPVTDIMQVRI